MITRIKKNDTVEVLSGKDKSKRGTVLEVNNKDGKILVKDIAMMKRHVKPRKQGETGGIKSLEAFIDLSKVMPVCKACGKPCRVNAKLLDDGVKVRMCNRCKEVF